MKILDPIVDFPEPFMAGVLATKHPLSLPYRTRMERKVLYILGLLLFLNKTPEDRSLIMLIKMRSA